LPAGDPKEFQALTKPCLADNALSQKERTFTLAPRKLQEEDPFHWRQADRLEGVILWKNI